MTSELEASRNVTIDTSCALQLHADAERSSIS